MERSEKVENQMQAELAAREDVEVIGDIYLH